jgi:hypothetical protein
MKEKKEHIELNQGISKMETGYTVPEGYFDSFGDRLKLRMEVKESVSRPAGILFYLKPALGLAAGLAIIVTVYLHPYGNQQAVILSKLQNSQVVSSDDQTDALSNTYASIVSDGQFISALTEMDEYDASKMSKEALADYLASNCSDFEILNANK